MQKNNLFIVIILIIGAFMVASCTRSDRDVLPKEDLFMGTIQYDQFKAAPYRKRTLENMPADKTSYAKGYQDGCKTTNSAVAEGLYRYRGPKIDSDKLAQDPWYIRGFDDASSICAFNYDWEMH